MQADRQIDFATLETKPPEQPGWPIIAVSHAINSHVLTNKNPCINQAIHVLLMYGFCTLHIRILGHHKNDVINSNVHRNERNLVTLG